MVGSKNSNDHPQPGPLAGSARIQVPGIATKTDGRGNAWSYAYDSNGFIKQSTAPDASATTYTYDPATLKVASMTDANGHRTEYTYDAKGNLKLERRYLVYPASNPSQYFDTAYDYWPSTNFSPTPLYDRLRKITYPNGSITLYEYDALGNLTKETKDAGGLNIVREWTYDGFGRVLTAKDPNGHVVANEYDAYGILSKTTDAEGHATLYEYDLVGNRTKRIDGNGHAALYTYDGMNRQLTETDPLGYVTAYAYDGNGERIQIQRQVTLSPATYETTQYQYDNRERLVKETRDPGGLNLVTQYAYDGNDNRIRQTDPRGKQTQYGYDSQNRLVKVTDALSNITQTQYDPVGNRTCTIDANGHYAFYEYDALNRLTRDTRKIGTQECTTADGNDILTQTFYDTGAAMACGGDPGLPVCGGPMPGGGNIAYSIDPEGKYTYHKYDKIDRRWTTIRKVGDTADACDPAGSPNSQDWCQYTQYDAADNVTANIDANGIRSAFAYYANNWLHIETLDPGGLNLITTTTYDGVGNAKTVSNPRGNVVTNTYDDRNKLVQVDDSIGRVASYAYDGIGNRISECDGNNNCTGYGYDPVNRLVDTLDPMGNHAINAYDPDGNLVKLTDRESHVTCHYYDDINRRTRTAQLMGGSDCSAAPAASDLWTDISYDAVGNVIGLSTARHSLPAACNGSPAADCETTAYLYDAVNRLVTETYADGTSRAFQYDNSGNLKQRTDQLGQVTRYNYNDLYYLMLRDYLNPAEPDDSYQYDIGGRMIQGIRVGWQVELGYDTANRVLTSAQDAAGLPMLVQYAYNTAAGTRDLTYPGGRHCHEQKDLRERLTGNTCDSFNAAYAYDPGNLVQTRTYNNGVVASYTYNANNWITSLTHSGTVADFGYAYDKEGNKQYEQKNHDPSNSEAYGYDDIYRLIDYKVGNLVGSTVPIPSTQTQYDLDKVGNWDQFTKDAVGYKNTPNVMNEYDEDGPEDGLPDDFKDLLATPAPDGENWVHDANGNRSEDGKRLYVYDDENRLVRVTRKSDSLVTEYRYDALGRRVSKTVGVGSSPATTRYAYDDARIVEERDATATTLATYVYGNYIDEVLNMQRGGTDYYYHQNALWSVIAVSNSSATVVERYDYSDYGCPSVIHSAIGNTWMFTGRQFDEESGLYFYRARYYDCESGRFLQKDPKLPEAEVNLYEYALSKPKYFVDPFGNKPDIGYGDYSPDQCTALVKNNILSGGCECKRASCGTKVSPIKKIAGYCIPYEGEESISQLAKICKGKANKAEEWVDTKGFTKAHCLLKAIRGMNCCLADNDIVCYFAKVTYSGNIWIHYSGILKEGTVCCEIKTVEWIRKTVAQCKNR